jgi:Sec-independent protein translocase protein TatA
MLEGLFQPTHLLVIFGIALLVFGPKRFVVHLRWHCALI